MLISILLASCVSTHHDFVKHPPSSQQDCMNLFQSINDIQKQRKLYMLKMDKDISKFKAGKMSKKTFHKKREEWITDEAELRRFVTTLYDVGYDHKCF